MTGRTLEEETVATLSVVFLGVEEEPPNGDIAEEAGQPMQGVQAVQDPEASHFLRPKVLSSSRLLVLLELCSLRRC